MKPLPVTLLLVDIRSAYNVGALFRTADAVGASLAMCGVTPYPRLADDSRLPHVADKAHQAIAKTALGAEANVAFAYFPSATAAIASYKQDGYMICALEQAAVASNLFEAQPNFPCLLLLGSETTGLPRELLDQCQQAWEIPMRGQKESLNVSVAGSIGLYCLYNFWLNQDLV